MAASGVTGGRQAGVGLLAGSTSVVADGVESAGDVCRQRADLGGLWVAAKPADENHPYGHGRFETLDRAGVGVGPVVIGMAIVGAITERLESRCTRPPALTRFGR